MRGCAMGLLSNACVCAGGAARAHANAHGACACACAIALSWRMSRSCCAGRSAARGSCSPWVHMPLTPGHCCTARRCTRPTASCRPMRSSCLKYSRHRAAQPPHAAECNARSSTILTRRSTPASSAAEIGAEIGAAARTPSLGGATSTGVACVVDAACSKRTAAIHRGAHCG